MALFAERSATVTVADLRQALLDHPGALARALRETVADLPDLDRRRPFDLILGWDLLDYLEPAEIELLGRHLARWSHRGTVFHVMVAIRRRIPQHPGRFDILAPGSVRYHPTTPDSRQAPLYRETALRRRLAGFTVESTFLLRHGVQEYLFRFEPAERR